MLGPPGLIIAQIGAEAGLAPIHLHGRGDGGEGGQRLEQARMAQGEGQRPVPAHGMPADPQPVGVDRQVFTDHGDQVAGDVGLHLEVRRPGGLGGIDVEARPLPEVVALVVGDALTARRGIGGDEHQPGLSGVALHAGLDGDVILGAGQPGEKHQPGQALARRQRCGGWRQEYRHTHRRAGGWAVVLERDLAAAEAAAFTDDFHRVVSSFLGLWPELLPGLLSGFLLRLLLGLLPVCRQVRIR